MTKFEKRVEAKVNQLKAEGYTQISYDWRHSTEVEVHALNQCLLIWRTLYMGADYDYEFWCKDSQQTLSESIERGEDTRAQYDEEGNYMERNRDYVKPDYMTLEALAEAIMKLTPEQRMRPAAICMNQTGEIAQIRGIIPYIDWRDDQKLDNQFLLTYDSRKDVPVF